MMLRGVLVLSALVLIVAFQNCSKFAGSFTMSTDLGRLTSSRTVAQVPETDKIDSQCMSSSAYDACLFSKNPVAAAKASIANLSGTTDLSTYQVFGVKLTGLQASGVGLSNGVITVTTLSAANAATAPGKFAASTGAKFAQEQAYYIANRVVEYLGGRTEGALQLLGSPGIKIVVDDTFTGWSYNKRQISLEKSASGVYDAWSSELVVQMLGQANAEIAAQGNINPKGSGANHVACNRDKFGCCSSALGCSKALVSAAGDYFVAAMLVGTGQNANIGETFANNVSGSQRCGKPRGVEGFSTTTAAQAYASCTGANGDVVVMGSVYASVFWEIRQSLDEAGKIDLDTLYIKHLNLLNSTDTFKTALEKAKTLDATQFNARFSSALAAAQTARGL